MIAVNLAASDPTFEKSWAPKYVLFFKPVHIEGIAVESSTSEAA